MLSLNEYIQVFIGIMAIFSPLSAIPIFISLTATSSQEDKNQTAKTVALAAGIAGIVSVWIGEYILLFFGISIAAFKIAGGILLLLMSINMLNAEIPKAKHTKNELEEAKNTSKEIAIVPLAIPLIAGPGAISTIIIFSQKSHSFMHLIIMSLIITTLALYIWGILRMSTYINKKLGITGINVVSRVMGLLLASISVQFIISGLTLVFPFLTK
ncbi:amino acid transporter [Malaciobacter molluscorum LMG 25693]|uniref:UPF0056 membrane protein n=1 Tax=Malaciobacter molluscorum LMG 25693 TaxID=870501 RepID=A0A2G1DLC1_9BACT|nr:MarC family protein [Malaciobacter molluscorum]AXX92086.1 small neutral amino acid transporter, MarC family [Malaciobacter molluscorum LMG 25693]PHO19315.1 amino acid transporter [Malaciobacter molluscorum LMG 25693]RXJ96424.1 amino acid transporter [Malaciobacter molluscorum]